MACVKYGITQILNFSSKEQFQKTDLIATPSSIDFFVFLILPKES